MQLLPRSFMVFIYLTVVRVTGVSPSTFSCLKVKVIDLLLKNERETREYGYTIEYRSARKASTIRYLYPKQQTLFCAYTRRSIAHVGFFLNFKSHRINCLARLPVIWERRLEPFPCNPEKVFIFSEVHAKPRGILFHFLVGGLVLWVYIFLMSKSENVPSKHQSYTHHKRIESARVSVLLASKTIESTICWPIVNRVRLIVVLGAVESTFVSKSKGQRYTKALETEKTYA